MLWTSVITLSATNIEVAFSFNAKVVLLWCRLMWWCSWQPSIWQINLGSSFMVQSDNWWPFVILKELKTSNEEAICRRSIRTRDDYSRPHCKYAKISVGAKTGTRAEYFSLPRETCWVYHSTVVGQITLPHQSHPTGPEISMQNPVDPTIESHLRIQPSFSLGQCS